MIQYVCGFLFSPDYEHVVLVRKNKPEFLKGNLNGVGGKVELGESIQKAMSREFMEETGVPIGSSIWNIFCSLESETGREKPYIVYFLYATSKLYNYAKTMEEEYVDIYEVSELKEYSKLQPNCLWLLEMALSFQNGEKAKFFEIKEKN